MKGMHNYRQRSSYSGQRKGEVIVPNNFMKNRNKFQKKLKQEKAPKFPKLTNTHPTRSLAESEDRSGGGREERRSLS